MLHLVELSHGPESCPAAQKHVDRSRLLGELPRRARAAGCEVAGGWAFPVGHRQWYVIDAPDAQTVADLIASAKLFHWSSVEIHPVLDHDTFHRTVLEAAPGLERVDSSRAPATDDRVEFQT